MATPESSDSHTNQHKSRWRLLVIVLAVGIGLFSISDIRELTGLATGDADSAIGGGCGGEQYNTSLSAQQSRAEYAVNQKKSCCLGNGDHHFQCAEAFERQDCSLVEKSGGPTCRWQNKCKQLRRPKPEDKENEVKQAYEDLGNVEKVAFEIFDRFTNFQQC